MTHFILGALCGAVVMLLIVIATARMGDVHEDQEGS